MNKQELFKWHEELMYQIGQCSNIYLLEHLCDMEHRIMNQYYGVSY